MKNLLLAGLCCVLLACAAAPVPDMAYYRMPAVAATPDVDAGFARDEPIVVDPLFASGVYNEQAILYALKPEGGIKAYHYQLWDDAPSTLLQRRLIAYLRGKRAAPLVADRLPAALDSLRIGGTVVRFERVRLGEKQWQIRVAMEVRVERDLQAAPLILRTYQDERVADGASIEASVRSFAQAVDACFDAFWNDFQGLGR